MLHAAADDLDRGIAAEFAALDALAVAEQPLEIGRTLLALGATQRRANSVLAARTVSRGCGEPVRRHRRAAVGGTGQTDGRLGGRRTADRDELTESERRIAGLAAEGRHNRDIAALLFVSERTVESNLTRAYRKLGVRSRTQLARHLAGARGEPAPEPGSGDRLPTDRRAFAPRVRHGVA